MTGALPPAVSLHGHHVWLEPIESPAQLEALVPALQQRDVFAGGWGGGEAAFRENHEEFAQFVRGYLPPFGRSGVGYLVCMPGADRRAGLVLGTTSYLPVSEGAGHVPGLRTVEIGCTAYSPRVWGTAVNVESKLLMLGHAFASGFERVVFNVDSMNERSLRAVDRLGAVREGVIEHHKERADGSWRDTVTSAVAATNWPAVEAGLRGRLTRLG